MKLTRERFEYLAAIAIVIIILVNLVPSILHARAQVRDDLRRNDLSNLKRALEMYNNQHVFYSQQPDDKESCTSNADPNSWLFGEASPLLKEQHIDAIPHDVREGKGYFYSYCATDIKNQEALGFYLQAKLEVENEDKTGFDEDEKRKFNYRVLHENNQVIYRVCGGSEKQCGSNE